MDIQSRLTLQYCIAQASLNWRPNGPEIAHLGHNKYVSSYTLKFTGCTMLNTKF